MEKLLLYKNKPEVFKCQFRVEGVEPEQTNIRLCLEFEDNKNLFFYGTLEDDGTCDIPIPSLNDIKHDEAKLVIEAIADSTYFKVYEASVKLKNSVGVKLLKTETIHAEEPPTSREPKIRLESVESQKSKGNPFIPRH
jgi:hypothetical protein